MKKTLILGLIVYFFALSSCNSSKCDRKDIICKSKEVLECLASDHYLDADKYFALDKGTILKKKKADYELTFTSIHKDLVKYGLPNDSSYRLWEDRVGLKFVTVTLIDSTKKDTICSSETIDFWFGNMEYSLSTKIINYAIHTIASKEAIEKVSKEMEEYNKEHPWPKDWVPPLH